MAVLVDDGSVRLKGKGRWRYIQHGTNEQSRMTHEQMQQAARNNAVWCDTVCRAHGRPGTFLDQIWINRHASPRFYPNAVTLTAAGSAAQLAAIRDLVAAGISGEWGVKDSFCALDLVPFGFRTLFEAQWIYRSTSLPSPGGEGSIAEVRWARIESAAALTDWEAAWGGESLTHEARIFLPALLKDENVAVIAGYHHRRIVAGAIANRAADAVGLSNLFAPARDADRFRAGCVTAVIDAFPGLPVVGYASRQELAALRALGFETLGPLRVWVRTTP